MEWIRYGTLSFSSHLSNVNTILLLQEHGGGGGGLGVNLAIRQITGLVFSGAALFSPSVPFILSTKRCTIWDRDQCVFQVHACKGTEAGDFFISQIGATFKNLFSNIDKIRHCPATSYVINYRRSRNSP
jgi:hypothetical protein